MVVPALPMQTLLESLPTRMERMGATVCGFYLFGFAAACDRAGAPCSPASGRCDESTADDDDLRDARLHAFYSEQFSCTFGAAGLPDQPRPS